MAADGGSVREQCGQADAAARLPEHHRGGQQREAAGAGHEQCLKRRTPRFLTFVLESDQQVRGETGELPEDEEGDEIVAEHDAQHRSHEGEERNLEAAGMRVLREVSGGVQHNQRADACDQRRKQHAKSVEAERQRQPETWRPRNGHRDGPVHRDQPECVREIRREHRGKERKELGASSALMSNPPSRRQEEKGRQDGQDVKRLRRHVSAPVSACLWSGFAQTDQIGRSSRCLIVTDPVRDSSEAESS